MSRLTNMANQSIVRITQGERALTVDWEDGYHSTFHYIWLRDNCHKFRHPENNQRLMNPVDIPADVHPQLVQINRKQQVEIVWAHDQHVSQFDSSWLRTHTYSNGQPRKRRQPKLWDASIMSSLPVASYRDVSTNKEALFDWLSTFRDYGFALLNDVPLVDQMVLDVGRMVSYIWQTGWDRECFDIKFGGGAKMIANTNLPLPAHTDDAYLDPAAPINILHCLIANTEGGESTLADGFKIAEVLRQSPEQFKLLTTLPIHFLYANQSYQFELEAPLIRLNELNGEVDMIRYSNQSTQPFHFAADVMEAYYDAYRTFVSMAHSDEYQIRFKLKPGDLYMINNYRILHGRAGFTKVGQRHLQSCYVGRDGLLSRLAVLSRSIGRDE